MRALALYARLFVVAVALNFVWEMAQAELYQPMGTIWEATRRCFVASLGDGVIVAIVALIGAVLFRSGDWFLRTTRPRYGFAAVCGLLGAAAVERWGLSTGRWQYNPLMPVVAATEFGLVPLLQMTLLVPISLRIAALSWRRSPRESMSRRNSRFPSTDRRR